MPDENQVRPEFVLFSIVPLFPTENPVEEFTKVMLCNKLFVPLEPGVHKLPPLVVLRISPLSPTTSP